MIARPTKALFLMIFATLSLRAYAAPHIFYTDLLSGPNTGGENNNGTILTISGKRFGASQGTST
jgi:hypothetical protein